MAELKASSRVATNQAAYERGLVQDVSGSIATVKLASGKQIRARVDVMFGRSAPAREGEHWMMSQEFGDWRFAACIATVPVEIRRYAITLGDGSTTSWSLAHGLGTLDVLVQAYNPITHAPLSATVNRPDADHVSLTFTTAPAANAARVVILG